jgi:exodeoxyribonuclease VII large subunit
MNTAINRQTRTAEKPKALSVSELTRLIKGKLEGGFSSVAVEGELSNVSRPASGHMYFTIKDSNAQISAVMFKGSQRDMKFNPAAGMVVRAFGGVSVYAPRGSYQIIVRRMEEGG